MVDREKVIKWLEICINGCDDSCPYKRECEAKGGFIAPMTDALALLKAQEPRVLALDEIHRGMVVWLEDKDKPEPILAIGGASAGGAKCFITVNDMSVSALDDEYNIRWRAWTECPTKEEMGATPWNG